MEGDAKLGQILKSYSAYRLLPFLHLALPFGDPALSSTISIYQTFNMAIWTSGEHGEEDTVARLPFVSAYHANSVSLLQKPSPSDTSDFPRTPRLDIGEIDAVPFSVCFLLREIQIPMKLKTKCPFSKLFLIFSMD